MEFPNKIKSNTFSKIISCLIVKISRFVLSNIRSEINNTVDFYYLFRVYNTWSRL